jgi:hypothetical protein
MAKFDWANSHKLGSIEELKKVKAEEGPDIVLWRKLHALFATARCESHRPSSTAHLPRLFLEKGKSSSVPSRTP